MAYTVHRFDWGKYASQEYLIYSGAQNSQDTYRFKYSIERAALAFLLDSQDLGDIVCRKFYTSLSDNNTYLDNTRLQDLTDAGDSTLHKHAYDRDLANATGLLTHEHGGLEADVNAYNGLVKISGGVTSQVTDNSANWDDAYTKRVDTWNTPLGLAANVASITQSGAATDGYLSSVDWNTFNDKQTAGNYITALTGEVTASGPGSVAATIANDAVTYAKMQNVSATDKLLGRSTAGVGDIEEIPCTAYARSILDDTDEAAFKATVNLEIGTDVLAQQTIGIVDNNLLEVDGTPNSSEYARFTASGLESRTEAEFKGDFNLEIGTDVQAWDAGLDSLAGLAYVSASFIKVTAGDTYAIRTIAETKTDLSLNNVTNVSTSDIAYDATTWNTNADASTKNAIRDKVETMETAIALNTAKNTNVSTALSVGTVNATTYGITSDGGVDDIVLPEADTVNAGLLGADKWDEIVANTTHKSSDGSDHSKVTANETAIGLNTAHRSSNGSDHTYLDQSVISGSSPTFDGANFTGIPSTGVTDNVSATANITDNTIIRGHGGGKVIQGSGITIDDSNNMSGMGTLGCGAITSSGATVLTHTAFPVLKVIRDTDLINDTKTTLDCIHRTTADMDNGFGPVVSLSIEDSLGVLNMIGSIAAVRANDSDNTGNITLNPYNAGTGSTVLTATYDKKVGINTSAPNATLDVRGDAIFNEAGLDKDFRIEASGHTHAFFSQGSDGFIGINNDTPLGRLHIKESVYNDLPIIERTGCGVSGDITHTCLNLLATKTTDMGNGFGSHLYFKAQDDTSGIKSFGSIGAERDGSDSQGAFVLWTVTGGANVKRAKLTHDGIFEVISGDINIYNPGSLGANLVAGWDFTDGWTVTAGDSIDDANTFTSVDAGGVYKTLTSPFRTYKIVWAYTTTASYTSLYSRNSTTSLSTLITSSDGTYYFTTKSGENQIFFRNPDSGTTDITTFELYEVQDGKILVQGDSYLFGDVTIGSSISTTDKILEVISKKDAGIRLIADTDNSGEDDNPYIYMSQNGGAILGVQGFCPADNKSPLNAAYTGVTNNAYLLGTVTSSSNYSLQFGTNNNVRMTISSAGAISLNNSVIINESGTDKDFRVEANGEQNALFVQGNNGFLGLNTNTPNYQLDVNGVFRVKATNHQIRIHDTDSGVDEWTITTYGNQSLAFYEDGATCRLILQTGGNLGIDTETPNAKLDINGNVFRLRTAKTPATAGASGHVGSICWDTNYIYVCVAGNTWKRCSIAAW